MSEFNKRTKKGWTLSGDYLEYRRDGGKMSPEEYNERVKEVENRFEKDKRDFKRFSRGM